MRGGTSLRFQSVRADALVSGLRAEGLAWEGVGHVTATTSLARALTDVGAMATPIATLLDTIVLPGWPSPWTLPLDTFPKRSDVDQGAEREAAIRLWQSLASGRRMRMGIAFDDAVRRHVRSGIVEPELGRVLVSGRRELSRTVYSLIAAGVAPDDVGCVDPVAVAARDAWRYAESEIPALSCVRSDLWSMYGKPDSDALPDELAQRVSSALEAHFGLVKEGERVLVHHGFYFYTPPQWALFQLLSRVPGLRQVFIVHDDGQSIAFETWRRFFDVALDVPAPRTASGTSSDVTPGATALRDALVGESLDESSLAGFVSVLSCRNAAEFVRELRHASLRAEETDGSVPLLFAADADAVDRFVKRLGRSSPDDSVDLAHVPVGAFLLAMHSGLPVASRNDAGSLSPEDLLDMASSGLLGVTQLSTLGPSGISAFRRAMPFFDGCSAPESWAERARALLNLVQTRVMPLGIATSDQTDLERIRGAVENPLRRAPWADLSLDEATMIEAVVSTCVNMIREVAQRERVSLRTHVEFVRDRLRRGMQNLPAEQQALVSAQIEGFATGLDDELEVDALVDVVQMLLGRESSVDLAGETEHVERSARELRSLDALGVTRVDVDVHLANLADRRFPSRVVPVGWPFALEGLRGGSAPRITVELFETREDTAALSDLYLFWLALDGVAPGRNVTLSYIENLDGEKHNPSAVLSLLARPVGVLPTVATCVGGLPIASVPSAGDLPATRSVPTPPSPQRVADASAAARQVDHRAAASAFACARRFAIQWALGPSASFQGAHHHAMLYGNTYSALRTQTGLSEPDAKAVCDDVWQFLTEGERESSKAKRVVRPAGGGGGADPVWNLTLNGNRKGNRPLDVAYQAAQDPSLRRPAAVVADGGLLPSGVDDEWVCRACPVKSRCRVAVNLKD